MAQTMQKRIVIYAKDIENITGRKRNAAHLLMKKIRSHFQKPSRSMVTVYEFCEFTGMRVEDVMKFLVS